MDQGNATDVTPLDFCKASDTVPHNVLRLKRRRVDLMDGLFDG